MVRRSRDQREREVRSWRPLDAGSDLPALFPRAARNSGGDDKICANAFAKVTSDKDLLADAKKGKLPIAYVSAEDSLKSSVSSQSPPEMVAEIAKYIRFR